MNSKESQSRKKQKTTQDVCNRNSSDSPFRNSCSFVSSTTTHNYQLGLSKLTETIKDVHPENDLKTVKLLQDNIERLPTSCESFHLRSKNKTEFNNRQTPIMKGYKQNIHTSDESPDDELSSTSDMNASKDTNAENQLNKLPNRTNFPSLKVSIDKKHWIAVERRKILMAETMKTAARTISASEEKITSISRQCNSQSTTHLVKCQEIPSRTSDQISLTPCYVHLKKNDLIVQKYSLETAVKKQNMSKNKRNERIGQKESRNFNEYPKPELLGHVNSKQTSTSKLKRCIFEKSTDESREDNSHMKIMDIEKSTEISQKNLKSKKIKRQKKYHNNFSIAEDTTAPCVLMNNRAGNAGEIELGPIKIKRTPIIQSHNNTDTTQSISSIYDPIINSSKSTYSIISEKQKDNKERTYNIKMLDHLKINFVRNKPHLEQLPSCTKTNETLENYNIEFKPQPKYIFVDNKSSQHDKDIETISREYIIKNPLISDEKQSLNDFEITKNESHINTLSKHDDDPHIKNSIETEEGNIIDSYSSDDKDLLLIDDTDSAMRLNYDDLFAKLRKKEEKAMELFLEKINSGKNSSFAYLENDNIEKLSPIQKHFQSKLKNFQQINNKESINTANECTTNKIIINHEVFTDLDAARVLATSKIKNFIKQQTSYQPEAIPMDTGIKTNLKKKIYSTVVGKQIFTDPRVMVKNTSAEVSIDLSLNRQHKESTKSNQLNNNLSITNFGTFPKNNVLTTTFDADSSTKRFNENDTNTNAHINPVPNVDNCIDSDIIRISNQNKMYLLNQIKIIAQKNIMRKLQDNVIISKDIDNRKSEQPINNKDIATNIAPMIAKSNKTTNINTLVNLNNQSATIELDDKTKKILNILSKDITIFCSNSRDQNATFTKEKIQTYIPESIDDSNKIEETAVVTISKVKNNDILPGKILNLEEINNKNSSKSDKKKYIPISNFRNNKNECINAGNAKLFYTSNAIRTVEMENLGEIEKHPLNKKGNNRTTNKEKNPIKPYTIKQKATINQNSYITRSMVQNNPTKKSFNHPISQTQGSFVKNNLINQEVISEEHNYSAFQNQNYRGNLPTLLQLLQSNTNSLKNTSSCTQTLRQYEANNSVLDGTATNDNQKNSYNDTSTKQTNDTYILLAPKLPEYSMNYDRNYLSVTNSDPNIHGNRANVHSLHPTGSVDSCLMKPIYQPPNIASHLPTPTINANKCQTSSNIGSPVESHWVDFQKHINAKFESGFNQAVVTSQSQLHGQEYRNISYDSQTSTANTTPRVTLIDSQLPRFNPGNNFGIRNLAPSHISPSTSNIYLQPSQPIIGVNSYIHHSGISQMPEILRFVMINNPQAPCNAYI